jgi:KTSC and Metallopeptidase N-terminal fusion domain
MYSFLLTATSTHGKEPLQALVKPEDVYKFFVFKGTKPVTLDFRGKTEQIEKGDKFGVRKSANGKQIRLIRPGAETRVFTLTQEQANALAKGIKK